MKNLMEIRIPSWELCPAAPSHSHKKWRDELNFKVRLMTKM